MAFKILGIGGIFFKSKNPQNLLQWYKDMLGFMLDETCATFSLTTEKNKGNIASVWSPFSEDTTYFSPSNQSFMINFRVQNLDEAVLHLKNHNVEFIDEPIDSEYGKFAWFMDPEGHKIELWEPKAQ